MVEFNGTEFPMKIWREAGKQLSDQRINDICANPANYCWFYEDEDECRGLVEAECHVAEAIKTEMPKFTACNTKALAAALALQILTGCL